MFERYFSFILHNSEPWIFFFWGGGVCFFASLTNVNGFSLLVMPNYLKKCFQCQYRQDENEVPSSHVLHLVAKTSLVSNSVLFAFFCNPRVSSCGVMRHTVAPVETWIHTEHRNLSSDPCRGCSWVLTPWGGGGFSGRKRDFYPSEPSGFPHLLPGGWQF